VRVRQVNGDNTTVRWRKTTAEGNSPLYYRIVIIIVS
jgi:hypothetical protein